MTNGTLITCDRATFPCSSYEHPSQQRRKKKDYSPHTNNLNMKEEREETKVNISTGSSSRIFYWNCTYQGDDYSGSLVEYYDYTGDLVDTEWNWYTTPADEEIKRIVEELIDNELTDEWDKIIK